MSSFDFAFNSPWWLVLIALVAALFAALWYYRVTQPVITGSRRAVLVFLRTCGLALLVLCLFEPMLTLLRSSSDRPGLSVLVDQSVSMVQRDARRDRRNDLRTALTISRWSELGEDVSVVGFDETVRTLSAAAMNGWTWNGQRTDIDRAMRYVQENAETDNTQAVLLFTDGAYTSGANPIVTAEQSGKPVYVIGIGDTTDAKDAAVTSIVTNDIGFVNATLPVQVTVRTHGYKASEVRLTLFDNSVAVQSATLPVRQDGEMITHVFPYATSSAGVHKLTARVDAMEGELTDRNNAVDEYVTIKDDKRKVLIVAGAPSPDVAFIRSALESMQGVSLKTIIQKSGAETYDESGSQSAVREADLVLFIGFPVASTSSALLKTLSTEILRSKKPLFFIASQNCEYAKLREFESILPFTVQSARPQEFAVTMEVEQSEESNAVLRVTGNADDASMWNALPPIFRTETFVRVKPEARVVAGMKVNNVSLGEPLIVSRSVDRSKCIAVLGYGLFRWKLLGTALDKTRGAANPTDMLSVLLGNATKWLSTDDEERKVRIRPSRSFYAGGESVNLQAQVCDDAMVPVEDATVTVTLASGSHQRTVNLTPMGSGQYGTSVEGLPAGDYAFNGTAMIGSRAYGKDAGRFTVGDLPLEFQNLRLNSSLLRSIAERTGGRYYTVDDCATFLDDLRSNDRFSERSVTRSAEWNLG
ncbi:MAG: hypothetical protein ACKOAG_10085 [Candidatus Kapaibacterium sp.]